MRTELTGMHMVWNKSSWNTLWMEMQLMNIGVGWGEIVVAMQLS